MSTNPFYGATRPMRRASETEPQLEGEPDPVASFTQLIGAAIALVLSFLSVALLTAWLVQWREGFSLQGHGRFNLHPLAMTLAVPFLLTHSTLAWRTWPMSHRWRKAVHAALNASALGLVGFGLYCVFTSQSAPYVFTAHSWIGLAAALLLGLQALLGLVYLLPSAHANVKATVLPLHAWLGTTAYVVAMLTVCTGVMNLQALLLTRGSHHYTAPPAGHEHGHAVMEPSSAEAIVAALLATVVLATLIFALYALMPRRAVEWEEEVEERAQSTGWRGPKAGPQTFVE